MHTKFAFFFTVTHRCTLLAACASACVPIAVRAQNATGDPVDATTQVLQQQLTAAIEKHDYPAIEGVSRTMAGLKPDWPDAQYNLACALAMQGRSEDALQALTRSIELGFDRVDLLDGIPTLPVFAPCPHSRRRKPLRN
jgi:hypothetical protein